MSNTRNRGLETICYIIAGEFISVAIDRTMQTFDVIVIGAGPAGATAAAAAAAAGLRVIILEKYVLPRHKTCGGGMPMTVGSVLRDLVPEAFVEADVRYMRHTWKFQDPYLAPINPPGAQPELTLWMVQRSTFDNALTQRAVQIGAEVRDGISVRSLERGRSTVLVRAETRDGTNLEFSAPWVIGADGANGVTAREVGLRRRRSLAIGLEVEHPHQWGDGRPHLRPDVIHLEYGAVPRGYAWVFPKAHHLNVGAGLFRPRRPDGRGDRRVREQLQDAICGYLEHFGLSYCRDDLAYYAHPLPIWNGRERLQTDDNRILLAGDAAGLINPIFGDGILHAIKSGVIAAKCVADGRPEEYTQRIHAELADNFDAAGSLAKLFYSMTGTIYKHGIKRPTATHAATRLLCGDDLFLDAKGRAVRILKEAIGSRMTSTERPTAQSDVSL